MRIGKLLLICLLGFCTTFANENQQDSTSIAQAGAAIDNEKVETIVKDSIKQETTVQPVVEKEQEVKPVVKEDKKIVAISDLSNHIISIGASLGVPELIGLKLEYSPKVIANRLGFLISGGVFPTKSDDGGKTLLSNVDFAGRFYPGKENMDLFFEAGYNVMMLKETQNDVTTDSKMQLVRLAAGYKFVKESFYLAPALGYNILQITEEDPVDGAYFYVNLSIGGTFKF